jgi:polar amino acid transport system substrate-binding protein
MKKILTLLMTLLLSFTACLGLTACGSTEDTLYVYTEAGFPPYEYMKDGMLVGVDVDIVNKIGEELGYKVVVSSIEFGQIPEKVKNNKMAVGAAGMTQKPDRDAEMLASISYATSMQYVIVPVGTFTSADLVEGKLPISKLAGMKIGTQEATTGYYMVADAVDGYKGDDGNPVKGDIQDTGASYEQYKNAVLASQHLGASLQAVVIDKLPAEAIVKGNDQFECFALDAEPESYVLYFNKEATELVEKVNKILQKMIDDGTIDQFTINHSGN